MSEIYDYVMEGYKGHAVMGESMRAAVMSLALWRLVDTDGSGYCRLRRDVYQVGDPKKTMRETSSLYERAIRIVNRVERELAGSFYANLDQGMDLKISTEAQKAGREVLDKLGQIKAELAVMQQEFTDEKECGQDQTSGMSMELQEVEDVYLPGTLKGKDCHVVVAASGSDRDWGRSFVFCARGGPNWGDYPGAYYGCLCLFNRPF